MFFFFQAEDGIRDLIVTGVQTCALPISTMDDALVTADFQGYVHWLDKASGALAARVSTGKVRISTAPVVVGNMVLVINDRGHISAFRVTPLAARAGRKSVPQTPLPQPTESK